MVQVPHSVGEQAWPEKGVTQISHKQIGLSCWMATAQPMWAGGSLKW